MTAKIELTDIPDESVAALRALADFIEAHPDIKIEKIELTDHDHSHFADFIQNYAADREEYSISTWATLRPKGGNDERGVQVEIVTFGPGRKR